MVEIVAAIRRRAGAERKALRKQAPGLIVAEIETLSAWLRLVHQQLWPLELDAAHKVSITNDGIRVAIAIAEERSTRHEGIQRQSLALL